VQLGKNAERSILLRLIVILKKSSKECGGGWRAAPACVRRRRPSSTRRVERAHPVRPPSSTIVDTRTPRARRRRPSSTRRAPRAPAIVDHRRHGAYLVTLASRLRAINHSTPKWWPRSGFSERSCVRPLGCGGCVLRLGGEHRVFACCASQASTAGSRRTASPKRVPPALVLRRLGEQRLLPYRSLKVMGPA
jgi:hypothetical protein